MFTLAVAERAYIFIHAKEVKHIHKCSVSEILSNQVYNSANMKIKLKLTNTQV